MPKRVKLEEDGPLPPPKPTGHIPRLLDERLIDSFAVLIERGLSVDAVCGYYCVPQRTMSSWAIKGKLYLLNESPDEHELYGKFVQALDQAMSKYRLLRSQYLHDPDSNAKSRLVEFRILERRDRAVWGKKDSDSGVETIDPSDKYL